MREKDQRRFWAKVALPNEQGCMLWLGCRTGAGYGQLKLDGRAQYVHRISYEMACGVIPKGMELDHVKARGCANRHCVAPEHLEVVTHRENTLRSGSVSAVHSRKTHCPQGHPYDDVNTYRQPGGGRICRTCQRAHNARYRREGRAA